MEPKGNPSLGKRSLFSREKGETLVPSFRPKLGQGNHLAPGIEPVRQVFLRCLDPGENIRSQTEPLTRRRLTIVTGAMVALFVRGWTEVEDFTQRLPELALEQMKRSPQSKNGTANFGLLSGFWA